MIKVVLFDYDGVLTHLMMEDMFASAWKINLKTSEKMKIFWKSYIKFGELYPDKIPYCKEFYELLKKYSGYEVNKDFLDIINMYVSMNREIKENIKNLIEPLSKKYKIGLFTGTFKPEKIKALNEKDVLKFFTYRFPIDINTNRKPHPDAFKSAQEKFDVEKSEVLLVDDNIVRGIFPAIRFGWKTCFLNNSMYLDVKNIPENLKPTYIIKELEEVKSILGV